MEQKIQMVAGFVACLFLFAGCANQPSVTDADGTKEAPGPVVAICYNASNTTRDLVSSLALEHCPKGATGVQVWDHDSLVNDCPISKRNRVTFLCLSQ